MPSKIQEIQSIHFDSVSCLVSNLWLHLSQSLYLSISEIKKNQAGNLDRSIEDLLEHFVYQPKKCTANAQDIPFFLSTRLADCSHAAMSTPSGGGGGTNADAKNGTKSDGGAGEGGPSLNTATNGTFLEVENPVVVLGRYEDRAAGFATEYEEDMVRF